MIKKSVLILTTLFGILIMGPSQTYVWGQGIQEKDLLEQGVSQDIIPCAELDIPCDNSPLPPPENIVGKLILDKYTAATGSKIFVQFLVENNTDALWVPGVSPTYNPSYTYKIFKFSGEDMGYGNLTSSSEPYMSLHSTGIAAGKEIVLKNSSNVNLAPGLYRILLFNQPFTKAGTGTSVLIGGSAAINVTP
ncbi:MAG: hypothetical protein KBD53_02940 [Candidatus Omnitrophica bacterium]|nr:hypothetical protein [Candidatus Omnitrophota bacterium]